MVWRPSFCAVAIVAILSASWISADENPPAKPPEKCTIRATIVTFDGLPYDDAKCICTVRSHQNPQVVNGETSYQSWSGQRLSPTQRKIEVQMPPGMVSLGVMLPGYATTVVALKEAKPHEVLDLGTIKLNSGFTWKLNVVNDREQPVPNAEVTAVCRHNDNATKFTSDAAGRIEFEHAAAEDYALNVRAPGHQPLRIMKLTAAAGNETKIQMSRARPTTGTVVDGDGQPVAGARILLLAAPHVSFDTEPRELARTDAAGAFTLDQLSDDFPHPIRVEVDGTPRFAALDVAAGEVSLKWKLQPSISLSGKVVGLGPQAGGRLTFEECQVNQYGQLTRNFLHGDAKVDGDGQFRITGLLPGVLRLHGHDRTAEIDLPKSREDYVFDLTVPQPVRPVVQAPARVPQNPAAIEQCTIRAAFATEDGVSLDGIVGQSSISTFNNPRMSNGETHYGSRSIISPTINRGRLEATVQAGMIGLSLSLPGYAPAVAGLKEAKPQEVLDFGTITVKRGFTWKLAVRNENDKPVANAKLEALCRYSQSPVKVTTNAEGVAELEHAAEDEYTFTLRAPGHQPLPSLKLNAKPGETAAIPLRTARPASGKVVDDAGQPVPGAKILLLRGSFAISRLDGAEPVQTDAEGKFSLTELADAVPHTVRVEVDKKPRLVVTNVQAGTSDLVWKLQPSLKLSGKIKGMGSNVDRNLQFDQYCLDHNGAMSGSFLQGGVRIDADDNFQIDGLIPGAVRLYAFGRFTNVPLTESRDDYVLDLTLPDPNKPGVKVKIAFVSKGAPAKPEGTLKGFLNPPPDPAAAAERVPGRRFNRNVLRDRPTAALNHPLNGESSIEILAFVPGQIRLTSEGLVGYTRSFHPDTIDLTKDLTSIVVELTPAGAIEGVVLDGKDRPVSDVSVSARATEAGQRRFRGIVSVQTNAKGEFLLTPVPFGHDYVVYVRSKDQTVESDAATLTSDAPRPKITLRVAP